VARKRTNGQKESFNRGGFSASQRAHPMPKTTKAAEVSSWIATMLRPDAYDLQTRRGCFFDFVSHLQWPNLATNRKAASLFRRAMYAGTSQTPFHSEELLELLFFTLDPNFAVLSQHDFLHANKLGIQLAAQTVRFLVSYEPDSHLKTRQPSLNKAYYALRRGAYGRKWDVTEGKFEETWGVYKNVSAFHYVNQLLLGSELDVDVRYTDYHEMIDFIVSDDEYFRIYFGLSLWVFERMKKVLYRTALRNIRLPTFPADLDPIQPHIAATDSRLIDLMAKFSKPRRETARKPRLSDSQS
jgi:hypothetical protein